MGKANNLVQRHTFSSEFHLPKPFKRRSIYGFENCTSPSLSLSQKGAKETFAPSGSATGKQRYLLANTVELIDRQPR